MLMENNHVILNGLILDRRPDHEAYGEKFIVMTLMVERLSGNHDEIKIMASERTLNSDVGVGEYVRIEGEFRSYNKWMSEEKHRLMLYVMADSICRYANNEEYDAYRCENSIELDGYICKPPVYRKTPAGREIADVHVAVNRAYGKSDYIPCVVWGRNTGFASMLSVGSRIRVVGRIQSREYRKQIAEDVTETRIAYEVSVNSIDTEEEDKCNGKVI